MVDSPGEVNLTALVIEEKHDVSEFVSNVLRAGGWNVSQSSSTAEAFERLPQGSWSVVFCDVTLGSANGYQALHTFKEEVPQAKVILMSSHGAALDPSGFGAYDYFLTSFDAEELRALSQALREQLLEHQPKTSPPRRTAACHSAYELVGRSQPLHGAAELENEEWVPLSEIEGRYVTRVLEHTRGNKQAAARILNVDRKTLDRMIKRHHIETDALRARAASHKPQIPQIS